MTARAEEPSPYIGPCQFRDEDKPHVAHIVTPARCEHEHTTWCYGVPEPGSVEAVIAGLQAGQRVLVVWEGVVAEPVRGPMDEHTRPAVVAKSDDGFRDGFVLRYTGAGPHKRNVSAAEVASRLHGGIISVKVLPE